MEIPEHNIMTEKENPELQKVLCTWKLAKKWKKLNIYSDVSGLEALIIFPVPSPVKTPRQMDLFFSIQALVFIGLARRFYIYLQIYNK